MCVVDASQIFAAPEMMELKLRQIAFADMLILNKTDLVGGDDIGRIRAWLDEHFHRYRLVESTRGDVPLEILLSAGRFDPAQLDTKPHHHHDCADPHCDHHNHTDVFSTWSYQTDEPLSLEALREAAKKLPASIYRCKGVVYSADAPQRRGILQVVGKRVDLAEPYSSAFVEAYAFGPRLPAGGPTTGFGRRRPREKGLVCPVTVNFCELRGGPVVADTRHRRTPAQRISSGGLCPDWTRGSSTARLLLTPSTGGRSARADHGRGRQGASRAA